MEQTRTDSVSRDDTLTAYEFAMEEVRVASSKLARTLESGDPTMTERECSDARSVYEEMIHLYPRVRLDATQRASLLKQLAVLRSQLEACKADEGKFHTRRR